MSAIEIKLLLLLLLLLLSGVVFKPNCYISEEPCLGTGKDPQE